jgi:hypothetical protein
MSPTRVARRGSRESSVCPSYALGPVRKLRSKRRVGNTVTKRYDAPRTPYQRMLLSGVLTEAQRQALDQQCLALDPIVLARDIQQTLDLLWKLADTRPIRREAARG